MGGKITLTDTDAFIVVDVQNDFVSGSLAIDGADEIIEPINLIAAAAPHVIVATDWHPVGHISFASTHGGSRGDVVAAAYGEQRMTADHCVQGTYGAELDSRLELTKAELILRKGYRVDVDSYGAFHENDQTATGLAEYLRARGIDRLFVAGLARYGCVAQTALGAAKDGFEVSIVDEASRGGDGERAKKTHADLVAAGVGWVQLADFDLG